MSANDSNLLPDKKGGKGGSKKSRTAKKKRSNHRTLPTSTIVRDDLKHTRQQSHSHYFLFYVTTTECLI